MNITIRQLKVFSEVARHKTLTLAAKHLHLTQPAVSMQIKQLEESVGAALLSKQGRRIQLTDAGEEMLLLSHNVLQQIEQTEHHLKQINEGHQGKLKLVVASTVSAVATKLLASFNALNPDMHISFDVTNRAGLIEQLSNNQADIVLMGQPPDNLNLHTVAFMENPLVVIAPPEHQLCLQKHPATINQLLEHGFVVRETGSGTRQAMERFFNENDKTLNSTMEMNSNEAIKQAVEVGLGLGVVSIHTLEHELKEKRLQIIDAEGFPIIRSWYLVQRKDKRLSPLAEKFKSYVLQKARLLKPTL
jgi:LysR family transcriptional regulator, low CO2-responsive transcriptional regulator